MKKTYQIEGMTCNGCRASVEKTLSEIKGVKNVSVDLESKEAIIETENSVNSSVFQNSLPEKYQIKEKREKVNVFANSTNSTSTTHNGNAVNEKDQSKLQQLKPLFIILGYITIATLLLNHSRESWRGAMFDFMGLFFIVFSFFKILDLSGFANSFSMYDPLASKLKVYAYIYPFIEIALGLMFLMRFELSVALIATLLILGITTVGVSKTLLDKKSIQCACLGTALKLPMTEATLIENAIMIFMAVWMLIQYFI